MRLAIALVVGLAVVALGAAVLRSGDGTTPAGAAAAERAAGSAERDAAAPPASDAPRDASRSAPGGAAGGDLASLFESAVSDAVGADVRWEGFDISGLPPVVTITGLELRTGAASDVVARAARVVANVSAESFSAGTLSLSGIEAQGLEVALVRTARGVSLRGAAAGDAVDESPEPARAAPVAPAGDGDSGPDVLALLGRLGELRVSEAVVRLEDRTLAPPAHWVLRDGAFRAGPTSGAAARPVEASASIDGGTLRAKGTVGPLGPLSLEVALEAVPLHPLAPYLGSDVRARGRVAGIIAVRGADGQTDEVSADLRVSDAALVFDDLRLDGTTRIRVDVRGDFANPTGRFEVDARETALDWGGAYRKAPGAPATATGRFVRGPDGRIAVEEVHVKISKESAR